MLSNGQLDCTQTSLVIPLQSVLKCVDVRAENAVLGVISMSSGKIWANHNQIILSILLHSADYRDVFDLSHHKG